MQTRTIENVELEAPAHTDLPPAYYFVAGATWQSERVRKKVLAIISEAGPAGRRILTPTVSLPRPVPMSGCLCPKCVRERMLVPSAN